jgi:hypothetical protein
MLTPLLVVGLFALLFLLERFLPLRMATRSLLARLVVNLAIAALTFVAAAELLHPAARWALRWSGTTIRSHSSRSAASMGGLRSVFC